MDTIYRVQMKHPDSARWCTLKTLIKYENAVIGMKRLRRKYSGNRFYVGRELRIVIYKMDAVITETELAETV